MAVVRCKEPFSYHDPRLGYWRTITAGAVIDAGDPAVKGREAYFEPVEASAARASSPVEKATAAPGEKRTVERPEPVGEPAPEPAVVTNPAGEAPKPKRTPRTKKS